MLKHPSLNAVLQGVQSSHNNFELRHYRGIRYAIIPGRFERAIAIDSWDNVEVDCRRFGYVPHDISVTVYKKYITEPFAVIGLFVPRITLTSNISYEFPRHRVMFRPSCKTNLIVCLLML